MSYDAKELYWAAGFLEGEGSFHWRKKPANQFSISANQVDPEPLYRLRQHWGGTVYGPLKAKDPRRQLFFAWRVGGPAAAALAMMLYQLMTGRRQNKIKECLIEWKPVQFSNRYKKLCKRGHEFTQANTNIDRRGHRVCRTCRRLAWRERYYSAQSEAQQPVIH